MFTKLYLIALPVFLAIDLIWLGLVAKGFYAKHLGYLMKTDVNWISAILFYLLFIVGVVVFVLIPAVEKSSLQQVIVYGALFGLVTYATYDLTNLATIKDWPLLITVIDLIWGTVLSTLVSVITYLIYTNIFK